MAILGGSLCQLLLSLIIILVFIFKHGDNFAAAISLWWLAPSMVDLLACVGDVGAQEMWLLGSVLGKDRRDVHD